MTNKSNICTIRLADRGEIVERKVNDIVGVLNTQYALLVDHVVELLGEPILWTGQGMTSIEHWLRWRGGLSPTTAAAVAAIARRADELPESTAAFRRGELSLDQMSPIAKRAPSWTDKQSLGYAVVMTVPQLRLVLAKYPFPEFDDEGREVVPQPAISAGTSSDDPDHGDGGVDPDVHAAAARRVAGATSDGLPAESCSGYFGDDGRYYLHAMLDVDHGKVFEAALDEARDHLFHAGHSDVAWVDALVEMATSSLGTIFDPARSSRFKVSMFVEASGASMTDAAGRVMPDSLRDFLTCDGAITPILTDKGLPVSVGRAQYVVPTRTRTVIEHRDGGGCRVPGCDATLGLQIHHIVHWEHGGPTNTDNLVLICGKHHRMHHRGRLGIAGCADRPDGLRFTNERGSPITGSGAAPNPPSRPPPHAPQPYEHPIGGRLDKSMVYFNPPREWLERERRRCRTDAEYLAVLQPPGY